MNSSGIVKFCFAASLFALQFEEFQIVNGVSVFLGCIVPLSIIGLINIRKSGDTICNSFQNSITLLLLLLALFNFVHGDIQGVFNKILLIIFCRFYLYCLCTADAPNIRYDYLFLITTILNFASLIFGFCTFKEGGLRFCGIYKDPNFLCITVLFALYSKLVFLKKNTRILKIVFVLLILLDCYMVFLSGSRGGLFVSILLLFVYMYFRIKSKLLKFTLIILSLIGFVAIWQYAQTLTMWGGYYDNPIDQVLSRFNAEKVEDGSHRTGLWENSFNYMNEQGNIIFPVGYENLKNHLKTTDTVGYSHNSYIDFASDSGYIVAIIVIFFLLSKVIYILKALFKKPRLDSFVLFMILASFSNIFLYIFLSAYAQKLFWVSFLMLFGVYHFFKTNTKTYFQK